MVGVPRSTGCSLCIKRRIKCDEARPSCANCMKYGTACPGYDKGLKFVVGKTHRSRRQQRSYIKQQKTNSFSPISESPSPAQSLSVPSLTSLPSPVSPGAGWSSSPEEYKSPELHVSLLQTFEKPPQPLISLSISSPMTYQAQCLSVLMDHLPPNLANSDTLIMSRWISFLPSRFGKTKALDSAIACFTTQQIGTTRNDQRMLRYSRSTYIQALGRLQKAISNPAEVGSSETLCATMLLCVYELFAGTTAFNSWMKHASGVSRLMQYRGPQSHANEFDQAMLLAFRGVITMECMFRGEHCFLAEEEWLKIARARYDTRAPNYLNGLFEDFCHYMALIPGLLKDGWDLRKTQRLCKAAPLTDDDRSNLVDRSLDLYYQFRAWGARFIALVPYPREKLSERDDRLFPVVFQYDSISAATIYSAYWANIIMLQEILAACGYIPEDAMEDTELVENICKTVEYNGQGTWGPFRMSFSLRIAWEIATTPVKLWIETWHVHLSTHYAAISLQALPEHDAPKTAIRGNPGRLPTSVH